MDQRGLRGSSPARIDDKGRLKVPTMFRGVIQDQQGADVFVTSGVYKKYAEMFLPKEQIDAVDEAALLAIQAKPFELPPEEQRKKRWESFLPEYQRTIRENDPLGSV